MKIYVAHSLNESARAIKYAKKLKSEGHEVYVPALHTDEEAQANEILMQNLLGIVWSDEVHVIWDGESYGTVFDMGNAFALRKPIKPVWTKRKWGSYFASCLALNRNVGEDTGVKGV